MKNYRELTQEQLQFAFDYNEETGELIWKNPTRPCFKRKNCWFKKYRICTCKI